MKIKRTFIIGDEWLYYKIYCGPKTADTILSEIISPLANKLLKQDTIDCWFFIRYTDPKNHIRVRFHLSMINSIVEITSQFNQVLQIFLNSGLVWKVMADTYQREIERYGVNTMELSERLFFNDSVLTSELISMIEGDEGENIRWIVGLRSINEFINDFNYSLEEKFELLTIMKDGFAKEFNMDKNLKTLLSNKFRKDRNFIAEVLDPENDNKSDYRPILDLIKYRSEKNKPIVNKILELEKNEKSEKPLNEFLWSYLHMLNNRLFRSNQRLHEFVMYYYLHQFYRSTLARMGIKVK